MTAHDEKTSPDHEIPSAPGAPEFVAILRNVIDDALGSVREDLAAIRASLGMTNGQHRSLAGRVTDLEERVDSLEFLVGDTEPPS